MHCPRCSSPNYDGAKFCGNCGMSLTGQWQQGGFPSYNPFEQAPAKDKTITYLLIYIGWGTLSSVLWLVIQSVITLSFFRENIHDYSLFFKIMSGLFALVSTILLIVFSVLTKNKQARIFMIIIASIHILLQLFYMLR